MHFEQEPLTWKYIAGAEFPGGRGSMVFDPAVAHEGKGSIKLQADFTGGVHITAGSIAGPKTGELWIDDVEGILNVDPADADR